MIKAMDDKNFILSENPFPTYIYDSVDLSGSDRNAEKKMQKAYEKASNLIDDANEELKELANKVAEEFENKKNTDYLDLARDLFRIYIKDGYNYGFSMILEYDDIYIGGLGKRDREYLENVLTSNALYAMKNIAKEVGMHLHGEKATDSSEESLESLKNDIRDIDLELKEAVSNNDQILWNELMEKRNSLTRRIMKLQRRDLPKAQDSADLQIEISITEDLAKELLKTFEIKEDKVVFRIQGSEYSIVHSDPIHHYFSDYDPDTFDSDDFYARIQEDGDLYQEVIDELIGETAMLLIWL